MDTLKLDLEEVKRLEELTARPRIINVLTCLKKEIEDEISKLNLQKSPPKQSASSDASLPKVFTNTITSYGWDQSEKFVKIYVSNLNGVQSLSEDSVTISYDGHYKLFIANLNCKNYQLVLPKLLKAISNATVKVKTDMVVIMLKKEVAENWSNLSAKDKDAQDKKSEKMKPPPMDNKDADPSKGIMDIMKKMYDDGDDEMKRTIAKAWTESRSKQGLPPQGMPPM